MWFSDSAAECVRLVVTGREPRHVGAAHRDRVDAVPAGIRIASEELIGRGHVDVDAAAGLVGVVPAHERRAVDRRRHVAQRVHVDNVQRDRVDRRCRNLVSRNGHAARREVDQRHTKIREIALPLPGRRHRRARGRPLIVAEAFVVAEEHHAVLLERTAHRAAELILLERLDDVREVVLRVERVVAHELVEVAVVLIAPRPRHHARRRAAGASELRRRALREDAELRHRVHRQLQRVAAVHPVDVLRTVHQVDVLLRPHAVDRVRLSLAQAAARRRHAGGQGRDAGLQQPELREVAAVQRQVEDLAPAHHRAQCVAGGVDELHAPGDGDGLGDGPDRQLHVDARRLVHVHRDLALREGREPRGLDRQAVGADRERRARGRSRPGPTRPPGRTRSRCSSRSPSRRPRPPAVLSVTTPSMAPVGSCAKAPDAVSVHTSTTPVSSFIIDSFTPRRGRAGLAGERDGDVAVFGDQGRALPVEIGIVGHPRGEAVHVAVAHAEHGGDEHRVVNLQIGGALLAGARDVGRRDVLAALRRLAGDREQRLQLRRDRPPTDSSA